MPKAAKWVSKTKTVKVTEIEQLRQALGLLSTLAPTVEVDSADPVGFAAKIADAVHAELVQRDDQLKALRDHARVQRKGFYEMASGMLLDAWITCDTLRAMTRQSLLTELGLRSLLAFANGSCNELFLAAGDPPAKPQAKTARKRKTRTS